MSWSRNEILRLIEEFKEQEVLWNHVALDHGTQQARIASWNYIASVFDRPVDEVRRKVSSLLASYRRTRILELKATEHPFKPTWEYYKYLTFMHERRKAKPYRKKPSGSKNHHNESYITDDDDLQIIEDMADQSYETSLMGDSSQMNYQDFNDTGSDLYVTQVVNLADDVEPLPRREKLYSSSYHQQTDVQSAVGVNNHYDKMSKYQVTSSFESSSNHDNHVPQISSTIVQGRPTSKNTQNSILQIPISQKAMHSRVNSAQLHTREIVTSFEEQPTSILPNSVEPDSIQSNEPSTTQLIPSVAKDECSTYGDYVACKLRCYPEKTKNVVQHYINNIIFEADMGKLC